MSPAITAPSTRPVPVTRARSLFVTLWGDVLAPHGERFWLSGIIALADALDMNQRLVRTTLFRLAEDGWLTSEKSGRQSRYALTEDGRRRVTHASQRIYGAALPPWTGYWSLVLEVPGIGASRRLTLEQDLSWQGFAAFAPGLYARPERDSTSLDELLSSGGLNKMVARFRAESPTSSDGALTGVIRDAYGLEQVALRYREFIERFADQLDPLEGLDAAAAFALRVRLIHEFRRVLLIDPELPHALLPLDWPGHRAYQLARILYQRLRPLSEAFVAATLGPDADPGRAAGVLEQRFSARR